MRHIPFHLPECAVTVHSPPQDNSVWFKCEISKGATRSTLTFVYNEKSAHVLNALAEHLVTIRSRYEMRTLRDSLEELIEAKVQEALEQMKEQIKEELKEQ